MSKVLPGRWSILFIALRGSPHLRTAKMRLTRIPIRNTINGSSVSAV